MAQETSSAAPSEHVTSLYKTRYGTEAVAVPTTTSAVIESLLQHRSLRTYQKDRPVTDDQLHAIVAAAQSAPTSSMLCMWDVVAVADPEHKARLADCAGSQQHIRDCPLFLVWLADLARLERMSIARGVTPVAVDYHEQYLQACIDAALAAQNAVAAAESLGLGTVYIGGIRNRPEDVAAILGLPPKVFAVFGLCLGYADQTKNAPSVKPRPSQALVLHREQYLPLEQQDAEVARFDEIAAPFYAAQHMPGSGSWTGRCAGRVKDVAALTGRHRLVEALNNLGFQLK